MRRIYDIHLRDFLTAWLDKGRFLTNIEAHLRMTDNEVTSGLLAAARKKGSPGYDPACRIVKRDHFRKLYERNPLDVQENSEAASAIFEAAKQEFGPANLRFDQYPAKGGGHDFPVLQSDNRIARSGSASTVLLNVPPIATEFIFVTPEKRDKAAAWLEANRESIIKRRGRRNG